MNFIFNEEDKVSHYVLDLGSHSAKIFKKENGVIKKVFTMTWEILERDRPWEEIKLQLDKNLMGKIPPQSKIKVIGTEAIRRNFSFEKKISSYFKNKGIPYQTITQQEESLLILNALEERPGLDVVDAGGGSIQIYSRKLNRPFLLKFGIKLFSFDVFF